MVFHYVFNYNLRKILVQELDLFILHWFYPIHGLPRQMKSFMNFHKYLGNLMDLINLLALLDLPFLYALASILLVSFLIGLFLPVNLCFLFHIFHILNIFLALNFKFRIILFQVLKVLSLNILFRVSDFICFWCNLRII